MMNKFYKTSYPKTSSINQILKNKRQNKKETFKKQDLLNQINKQTLTSQLKVRQKFHLDQKIQIEPQLLFSKNEYHRKVRQQSDRLCSQHHKQSLISSSLQKKPRKTIFQQLDKRKQQNKTQTRFYEQPVKVKLRPQSKQQSRRVLLGNASKLNEGARPQTSKGSRKIAERIYTGEDQNQVDVVVARRQGKGSTQGIRQQDKAPENKRKYNFRTSIDDQFLSLFAS